MKTMHIGTTLMALLLAGPALASDSSPLRMANGVLVDAKGMTVYTYDKDAAAAGKSVCVEMCARNWPPVVAGDMRMEAPYATITRDDGSKQLTHEGKPLYTFIKDKKEGDRTGDGVGGVWHVVTDAKKK